MGNPSQSYGASLAIWDHSVTCHPTQVNAPRHNCSQPSRYSSSTTRFTYPGRMEAELS